MAAAPGQEEPLLQRTPEGRVEVVHPALVAVQAADQLAPGAAVLPLGRTEQRQRVARRVREALHDDGVAGNRVPRVPVGHAEVEHDPVARVVHIVAVGGAFAGRGRPVLVDERLVERSGDLGGGLGDLVVTGCEAAFVAVVQVGGGVEVAPLPVVRDLPRLAEQLPQAVLDGACLGADALQVAQRAGRLTVLVVDADDPADVPLLEAREQPGLVEAPVPLVGRTRVQEDEQVARCQPLLDRTVPVASHDEVLAGDPRLHPPPRVEDLEDPADGGRQLGVGVLVADEDAELRLVEHARPPSLSMKTRLARI